MCAVDANRAASRWLAVTYLTLVATTSLWLPHPCGYTNQSHTLQTFRHTISHTIRKIFTRCNQSHTTYMLIGVGHTPVAQYNHAHNTTSHTTRPVTQHNHSHNIIIHTGQSISSTEYKQSRTTYVCVVQSATPLWLNTISHATQSVTQHNQSHSTIGHTIQSVTQYIRSHSIIIHTIHQFTQYNQSRNTISHATQLGSL